MKRIERRGAVTRLSREEHADPGGVTARFKVDELRALVSSSSSSESALSRLPPPEAASIDVVVEGDDVEPPERRSEPSSVGRWSSGIVLLSRPSPVLLIPERLTVPPLTAMPVAPPDVVAPAARATVAPLLPPPPGPPAPPPRAPAGEARPIAKRRFEWRESNLARRPAAFNFAHGLLELLAIVVGFAVTTLCLMACAGAIVDDLGRRIGLAVVLALALPAAVARWVRPKDDPLVALGLTAETYALLLLGFAVAFVIVGHPHTASLLVNEGDRAARVGVRALARAEWFLARVEPR